MSEEQVVQRDRWRPVGCAIVVLTVFALSFAAYVLLAPLTRSTGTGAAKPLVRPQAGPSVAWAGEGRYAVVQFPKTTKVGVWDRRTKKGRVLDGYRLVSVEPAAPRVWLVPDDGRDSSADVFGDAVDAKPFQLLVWDLSDVDARPSADIESRWKAWKGPGRFVAYPEVNILKGAGVAKVFFQNARRSGDGVEWARPEGVETVQPVGWSPSGTYFAVVTLAPQQAPASAATLLVFDARDGSVAASATVAAPSGRGDVAAWGVDTDEIYTVPAEDGAAPDASGTPAVRPVPVRPGSPAPAAVFVFADGVGVVDADAGPSAFDPLGGTLSLDDDGLAWASSIERRPASVLRP